MFLAPLRSANELAGLTAVNVFVSIGESNTYFYPTTGVDVPRTAQFTDGDVSCLR